MIIDGMYIPVHPVHPYDILQNELKARGISNRKFAIRIGLSPRKFHKMLYGKGRLGIELAKKLERELNIPAKHWLRFMERYIRDKKLIEKSKYVNPNRTPDKG